MSRISNFSRCAIKCGRRPSWRTAVCSVMQDDASFAHLQRPTWTWPQNPFYRVPYRGRSACCDREQVCQVSNNSGLYSKWMWFESRHEDRYSWGPACFSSGTLGKFGNASLNRATTASFRILSQLSFTIPLFGDSQST